MNRLNKIIKLALSGVLALLFVLMFRYSAISPTFHEIGGLSLFVLAVVHVILSRKWLQSFFCNLINKPIKARVQVAVDVLFAVALIVITGTGVAMSRVLPVNIGGQSTLVNLAHTSASYAALAFLGIHLGLNWGLVRSKISPHIPLPAKARKVLAYVSLAVIIALGTVSLTSANFGRHEHGGPKGATTNCLSCHGSSSSTSAREQRPGNFGSGSEDSAFSLAQVIQVVLNFGSFTALFGIAAYYLSKISRKARRA